MPMVTVMKTLPIDQVGSVIAPAAAPILGWRARALMSLEALFPPLASAPVAQGEHAEYEFRKAAGSHAPAVREIGGITRKTVLDFGCGWGGETVWLAQQCQHAIGCDISSTALHAAEQFATHQNCSNVRFVAIRNNKLPLQNDSVDAVFSTNVFEHVMDPVAALREIQRVLRPGGSFLSRFGPLFFSPLGYHVPWATQVPFAHLLFGVLPIAEVCRLKRPENAGQPLRTWEDFGLNRITFSRFSECVAQSGLSVRRLQRIPVRNQRMLAQLQMLGDLFTFGIDCHLIKR